MSDQISRGEQVRREVMGDEYVDRAMAAHDAFDRPLQELITEVAFGRVWDRPGLDRRERSLITVAMLAALGRSEELELHLRAAIRNGVTSEQLREALLHAAIYCGIPAAASAFRVAKKMLAEA